MAIYPIRVFNSQNYARVSTEAVSERQNCKLSEILVHCINDFESQLLKLDSAIFKKHPVELYLADVSRPRLFRSNRYWSPAIENRIGKIEKENGKTAKALYHKLCLSLLIKNLLGQPLESILPGGVLNELFGWLKRVVDDFFHISDNYYDFVRADFRDDLTVCTFRSLPVGGAWFVMIRRIGLLPLLTTDLRRIATILKCVATKTLGFSPFCVLHTFSRYALRFNCENMKSAYRNIGELLLTHPKLKGIYRRSWLLDPQLETISPELAFVRKTPESHGAVFYKVDTEKSDINLALKLSRKRSTLHREGKYRPEAYAYIWPRAEFLRWYEGEK